MDTRGVAKPCDGVETLLAGVATEGGHVYDWDASSSAWKASAMYEGDAYVATGANAWTGGTNEEGLLTEYLAGTIGDMLCTRGDGGAPLQDIGKM